MSEKKITENFINLFREIFSRIPPKRKKQFWLILIYTIFSSIVATIAVGSIALFATAFSSHEQIVNFKYIVIARELLHLDFLNSPKGIMIFISVSMVILIGLKNLLDVILFYLTARYGAAVEAYFGELLFNGFLHMPYQWHLNHNSADIVLALQWRSQIGQNFFNCALKTLSDIFQVLFLMLAVFLANPYILLALFFVSGLISIFIYSKIHHLQDREAEKAKEYSMLIHRQLTKGIHAIKDIKISGKSSFLTDFKEDAYGYAYIIGMRSFFTRIPVGLLETIGFTILASTIIFMLYFASLPLVEVTSIISLVIVTSWRILPAMSRIMSGFLRIRNLLPYIKMEIDHIKDIETNAVYPPESGNGEFSDLSFENEIQVKNISFVYQNRKKYVLKNINFNIKKGKTIGIVGCSGAGKSTLVDIVIGLLQPVEGQVLIDGCELDMNNIYAWIKQLSYVPQSPYISDGTIAENVAFGVRACEIDRDFVLDCCNMAYMQDVLTELPDGIDTFIGERGVRLSGGQRQRVAIARALYTRPEVIIFDEATSSLDSRSENAIRETIDSLKGMKTLIIVAHRLKTVENCDCLVWLKDGEVEMFDFPKKVLCEYEESLK